MLEDKSITYFITNEASQWRTVPFQWPQGVSTMKENHIPCCLLIFRKASSFYCTHNYRHVFKSSFRNNNYLSTPIMPWTCRPASLFLPGGEITIMLINMGSMVCVFSWHFFPLWHVIKPKFLTQKKVLIYMWSEAALRPLQKVQFYLNWKPTKHTFLWGRYV